MITEKITCDVCGAQRGIDNHWLMSVQFNETALSFYMWSEEYFREKQNGHICSAECAAKHITQTLLTKKHEAVKDESDNFPF